jgi:hypothetical protein
MNGCATILGMPRFARICVFAAFALLTLAGADLFADLVSGALCDGSSNTQCSGSPNDECFCCCGHYVAPVPPIVLPEQKVAVYEAETSPVLISNQRSAVYHPPRS